MSQHVPEDLLQAFVDGDVGEQVAVHVAQHLDACPACATRSAGLEPLAAALAAVEDPAPPEGLAESVLERAKQPERLPVLELALGAGLLLCAAALALALQSPVALAADFGAALNGVAAMARGMSAASSTLWIGLAVLAAAAGGAITLHLTRVWADDPSGAKLFGWGSSSQRAP